MINQLAQMFSSQGVLVPGLPQFGLLAKNRAQTQKIDLKSSSFANLFDQASAKLELSKASKAEIAKAKDPSKPNSEVKEKTVDGTELSDGEKKEVKELEKRDREVRTHEQAHVANAGGVAKGGANYELTTGPDGKQYAVGGHVNIDAGPASSGPQGTLQKAQSILRAALAPADPSGADRAAAANAIKMERNAREEIQEEQQITPNVKTNSVNANLNQNSSVSGYQGARQSKMGSSLSVYA